MAFKTNEARKRFLKWCFASGKCRHENNARDPYFSTGARVITGMKQKKIAASQVIPFLKARGVSDREIKWMGLDAYLKNKKSVTKEELLELAQQPRLAKEVLLPIEKVTTKHLSMEDDEFLSDIVARSKSREDAMMLLDNNDKAYDLMREELSHELTKEELDNIDITTEFANRYLTSGDHDPAKFSKYKADIKGADNYQEILYELENSKADKDFIGPHYEQPNVLYHRRQQDLTINEPAPEEEIERVRKNMIANEIEKIEKEYTGKYGKDKMKWPADAFEREKVAKAKIEKMDLSHLTLPKKVMFIDEIQSDWHQKGRRIGYDTKITREQLHTREVMTQKMHDIFSEELAKQPKIKELINKHESYEQKLERIKKEEKGHLEKLGKIPFNTRVKLIRDDMETIEDAKKFAKEHNLPEEKADAILKVKKLNSDYQKTWRANTEIQGKITDFKQQLRDDLLRDNQEYRVAAQTAEKLSKIHPGGVPDAPYKKTWHERAIKDAINDAVKQGYDGIAWTTGRMQTDRYWNDPEAEEGEGMKGFYDEILPRFTKKYIEPYNSKLEKIPVKWLPNENIENNYETEKVHYFDITPEMEAAINTYGQPVFGTKRDEWVKLMKEAEKKLKKPNLFDIRKKK